LVGQAEAAQKRGLAERLPYEKSAGLFHMQEKEGEPYVEWKNFISDCGVSGDFYLGGGLGFCRSSAIG
jgi:hypothetical protein